MRLAFLLGYSLSLTILYLVPGADKVMMTMTCRVAPIILPPGSC
jgi:hypothetical protein